MRQDPSSNDLAYIRRMLAYDPEKGLLTWAVPTPRTKPGDEAGSLDRNGFVTVRLDGTTYMGHYLAWFLHYGKWPAYSLKLRSVVNSAAEEGKRLARSDLRIANIVSGASFLSADPRDIARREYAREAARQRRGRVAALKTVRTPLHPHNVAWSPLRDLWVVFDAYPDRERPLEDPDPASVSASTHTNDIATATKLPAADRIAFEYLTNKSFLLHARPRINPDHAYRTAGALGAVLREFNDAILYDAERGVLMWRTGPQRALSAARPRFRKPGLVQFKGRRYSAPHVAWFLDRGEWVPRGYLTPVNGDSSDLRAINWKQV